MGENSHNVVILGANGTMGIGATVVFAGAGYHVTMLARSKDKAREGLIDAQATARAEAVGDHVMLGTYEADLAKAVAKAGIVFESLAEDLALKQNYFEQVDRHRLPDSVVATGSSGLSIAAMARGRSDSFRSHFLGIHLFNPPHVIVGTEVIPHDETDPAVVKAIVHALTKRMGRKVIVTKDRPAFVGNRVGFKVLNEVAQLAGEHGVAKMDYLVGPQTGRAMAPLATIDLVGWDVHKAIVDNVHAHCPDDEARACFAMPSYMETALKRGMLGDKTPELGGFYRRIDGRVEALDPHSGGFKAFTAPEKIGFVERMKALHHVGRYRDAVHVMCEAEGAEADLVRRVTLGYVSYALNRVGEVAHSSDDVDTIMGFGFNWSPPAVLVDLMGAREALKMLGRYKLKVPPILEQAAASGKRLYSGGLQDYGRTFVG